MKKSGIKIFIILLILGVLILGVIYFIIKNNVHTDTIEQNQTSEEFVQTLDDGTKLNTSTKLNENKNINGLQIGNIQLKREDNKTTLLADVENVTDKTINEKYLDIILIDKEAKILTTIPAITVKLEPGEKTQLNIGTQLDYVNAYDFRIIEK
mgnify:FL=1